MLFTRGGRLMNTGMQEYVCEHAIPPTWPRLFPSTVRPTQTVSAIDLTDTRPSQPALCIIIKDTVRIAPALKTLLNGNAMQATEVSKEAGFRIIVVPSGTHHSLCYRITTRHREGSKAARSGPGDRSTQHSSTPRLPIKDLSPLLCSIVVGRAKDKIIHRATR